MTYKFFSLRRKKRQLFDTTGSDNFLAFPTGFGLNNDFVDALQEVDLTGLITGSIRPTEPECPDRDGPELCDELSPFRTHSGYCNNLKNPNLGKSLATFSRLMPPVYENGESAVWQRFKTISSVLSYFLYCYFRCVKAAHDGIKRKASAVAEARLHHDPRGHQQPA